MKDLELQKRLTNAVDSALFSLDPSSAQRAQLTQHILEGKRTMKKRLSIGLVLALLLCLLTLGALAAALLSGQEIIEGVVKTYFQDGGQHIQINVVDNETLRKAQQKPEDYKGLMVRVAGYMAYFTELDKSAQDVIIDRTPHLNND